MAVSTVYRPGIALSTNKMARRRVDICRVRGCTALSREKGDGGEHDGQDHGHGHHGVTSYIQIRFFFARNVPG